MHSIISPICRFCLEENEEFNHLADSCPALYWERQQIWSQDPQVDKWTPQQIINFTCIPKINDAFAKPLYITNEQRDQEIQSQHPLSPNPDDPDTSRSDISVMDTDSLPDSSSDADIPVDSDSDIDIINF